MLFRSSRFAAALEPADVPLFIPVSVLIKCGCMCVSLRWVKQDNEISKNSGAADSGPKLDLGFKEGQTITLNIGVTHLA